MQKNNVGFSDLRARLLAALAANRAAQLNFPGVFLRLAGEQEGREALALRYDDGDWSRNAAGEVQWPVLGVLLDVALGAATRLATGSGHRPATVQLEARFTGARITQSPVARTRFVGYSAGTAVTHAVTAGTLMAGDAVVAQASGSFVMIGLPEGVTQKTLPWVPAELSVEPLSVSALHEHERAVLRRFDRACRTADAEHGFVERFWAGVPLRRASGARLSVPVGPHLGNRVGHVHGGILFGLAAHVACAAVPAAMRLANITAWFVSPGQGARLSVRSDVLQQGRNVAVVRTQITGAGGKRVLEATSQHLRAA